MIGVVDAMIEFAQVPVERDAAVPTWFGLGGRADRLARPRTTDELRACLREDPSAKILGDGANLLVLDGGVRELVVTLAQGQFVEVEIDVAGGLVRAGAGAKLPQLITATARAGLGGLETLAGIPASIGGAVRMNAGGAFGQTADHLTRVFAMGRSGEERVFTPSELAFAYRESGLGAWVVTGAEFSLKREEPAAVRARMLEAMEYKKKSQPLADRSAGCAFKNPTLACDLAELVSVGVEGARAGRRLSAGLLIDRAGCKGMRVGGASVSGVHANFIVTDGGATAGDVLDLMHAVRGRVKGAFGVELEPEVVVWGERA